MPAPPNEVIFVAGQRGSGKSYWTKQFIKSLPRCIVWDYLGEYETDERYYDLKKFLDRLKTLKDSTQLFSIAFDTHLPDELFPVVCRAVLSMGNVYFVIEEIDLVSTPYSTCDEFKKLIKYGRHYGVQLVGVTRRPAETSRLFTSQATKLIIFSQREPSDLKYYRSMIGGYADQLPTMAKQHYLEIDFNSENIDYKVRPPI